MAVSDDERFRVRPTPPRSRGRVRAPRFVSRVLTQVSKAGANASGARGARPASTFGRGRVAAGLIRQPASPHARRVVIKSRFVRLRTAGAKSVATHLRYIERDGVSPQGQRGQAYGPDTDAADMKAFEERGQGDRHQFRFIVSVEDAGSMDTLRDYTREFMHRMETDLETRLDWVAVDHWDTDNPHTHIVLRGRASHGQDLVIAPDYLAHGMRARASGLATEWLGPRTEREIQQSLLREVEQERFTSLDRTLLRSAARGVVDLTQSRADRSYQALMRGRLQRLERMGLAARIEPHRWQLSPDIDTALTAMGERGDILRTMQRSLAGQPRAFALSADRVAVPVLGRIVAKGLADELHDRAYLVVDGVDGRAHYLHLPMGTDLAALPRGGIVDVRPAAPRRVDKNIAAQARDGLYRTTDHLARLQAQSRTTDAGAVQSTLDAHVRRLEALRRAGVVERLADGVWRVPPDLPSRGQTYDVQRSGGAVVDLQSHSPIGKQTRAMGSTWLDRQLIRGGEGIARQGFGAQVHDAMSARVDFLVEQGLAERRGQRVVLARNVLGTLRERDIDRAAKTIQAQTGLVHRPLRDGERISGTYRRSVLLTSGRFAMLDDGMGFSLVPWRPAVEQRLGQQVSAVVRGNTVTWDWGRQRGISR